MQNTPSTLTLRSDVAPALAFLGPLGTYSHQAAFDVFGDSVQYVAKQTIAGKSIATFSLPLVNLWIPPRRLRVVIT